MQNNLNNLGLDTAQTKEIAKKLNQLLAELNVFYINVRGFHWNIQGDKFFELHLKFEELYTDLLLKIDEVAERVVTLGFSPLHSYQDYLNQATIKPITNLRDGKEAAKQILIALKTILRIEREILKLADNADDQATSDFVGTYLHEQEKLSWMYTAYLN